MKKSLENSDFPPEEPINQENTFIPFKIEVNQYLYEKYEKIDFNSIFFEFDCFISLLKGSKDNLDSESSTEPPQEIRQDSACELKNVSQKEKKQGARFLSRKRKDPFKIITEENLEKLESKRAKSYLRIETKFDRHNIAQINKYTENEYQGKSNYGFLCNIFNHEFKTLNESQKKDALNLSYKKLIEIYKKDKIFSKDKKISVTEGENFYKNLEKINGLFIKAESIPELKNFLEKKMYQLFIEFSIDEKELEKMSMEKKFMKFNEDFAKIGKFGFTLIDVKRYGGKFKFPGYLRYFLQLRNDNEVTGFLKENNLLDYFIL